MTILEAKRAVSDLVDNTDSSVVDYRNVVASIDQTKPEVPEYFRKIRVAFLSNFTLMGLPEVFKARAIFHNIFAETYLGPYNQIAQEIINKESGLLQFSPDIVYIVLDSGKDEHDQLTNLALSLRDQILGVKVFIVCPGIGSAGGSDSFDFLDLEKILKELGLSEQWNTKYKELGDLRLALDAFPLFAEKLLEKTVATSGATKKCLVVDLDNTLWIGAAGEEGFENVEPNRELQQKILDLYRAGTILAINSKNNEADAWEVFEKNKKMILKKKHFAAWQINWQDKATNIKALAEELMLGADSFVFMDDEPFQRNLVREFCPEVAVIYPWQLMLGYAGFSSSSITAEDVRRGEMYAEERARRSLQSSVGNLEDFIKSLEMTVTIKELNPSEANQLNSPIITRVAQMTQKTNQFNMRTQRFSEEEIKAKLLNRAGTYKIFTIEANDKFGHYGTIGMLSVSCGFAPALGLEKKWHIDQFLMSCRILGRGIEDVLLRSVITRAKAGGVRKLVGHFIPTKKNKALCEKFYPDKGFNFVREGDGGFYYDYDLSKDFPVSKNINVVEV